MPYEVARVRGLYPAVADGWVHFDPHYGGPVPEAVTSAASVALRTLTVSQQGATPAAAEARHQIDAARLAIADLVGGSPAGVVLLPSRFSLVSTLARSLLSRVWLGTEVVVSRLDDEDNILPWESLAEQFGASVKMVEADIETGELPGWQFERAISSNTSVVAVTAASSILGTVVDTRAAAKAARAAGALLVVDVSAAIGHLPIDLADLGADVLIFDTAAIGAGQGAALVFADPARLSTVRNQSIDPGARGTELLEIVEPRVSSAAAIVAAVNHIAALDETAAGTRRERVLASVEALAGYQHRLLDYLLTNLAASPAVHVLGKPNYRVPVVSFTVQGVAAAEVVERLVGHRITAATGRPSRLLNALGVSDAGGAVTIGLAPYSTPHEVDQLVRAVNSLG